MYKIFSNLPESPLELIEYIFRELFVRKGYAIREEQIALAKEIYLGISRKKIIICEAGVGLGKTYAYLVAGMVDAIYQMHRKEKKEKQRSFGLVPRIPSMVITTSSIELQHALAGQYISELSEILLEAGLIPHPLKYTVRKGKEHFLCRHRLHSYKKAMEHKKDDLQYHILQEIIEKPERIDLDKIGNISEKTISRINIPAFCGSGCRYYKECYYIEYKERAEKEAFDIQICNHNYYLVSETIRRKTGKGLLQPYRFLVVDEAHKLEEAAMQIHSVSLHSRLFVAFYKICKQALYGRERKEAEIIALLQKISEESNRLFRTSKKGDEGELLHEIPYAARCCVRSIKRKLEEFEVIGAQLIQKNILIARQKNQIVQQLTPFEKKMAYYYEFREDSYGAEWIAYPAVSAEFLQELWKEYRSSLLISGTLAARDSFHYFKKHNGLENILPIRVQETVYPSPFAYQEHARLYISEQVPVKNIHSEYYLSALMKEILDLIVVAGGRTAILFTSYRLLVEVGKRLEGKIDYPIFRTTKEDKTVIQQYRNSGNGVLLATGTFWEGVDCPGDILSMLIIPVLPFPVPEPVGEQRKKGYESLVDYIDAEITPAMIVKLKQGAGRLIRTETDRGVLAILDKRAAKGGRYRDVVLDALKEYPVVDSMEEIASFLK